MTESGAKAGFDRRSLIKKGLVVGGIAATAPVISTFNTAAFAQSLDGVLSAQYTIVVNSSGQVLSITYVPLTSVGACFPFVPQFNDGAQIPQGDITVTNNVTSVDFSVFGDCVWIDEAADFGNGAGSCLDNTQFSPTTGDPITWTPGTHSGGNRTYRLRLVSDCG